VAACSRAGPASPDCSRVTDSFSLASSSTPNLDFGLPATTTDANGKVVTYSYDATCPATLKLADAEDGKVLSSFDVTGRAKFTGDTESGETPAEEEAARDAGTRAVKKLRSELGR